jgi:23S rRNA pseudouridine2605 synthase
MVADDERNRPTLKSYLKTVKQRVFPVGRMDFNGEGLILLTNDGDFSAELLKNQNVTRTYEVKVKGAPNQERLDKLAAGGRIEGKRIKPHAVRVTHNLASKHVIEVIFIGMGALNVKELFVEKGYLVERVLRTAIGHISIRGIPPGTYKILKKSQIEALIKQPELGHRSHKPVI